MKEIYLAGGCFWGTEHYLKQIRGVVTTEVGYANGNGENPSYEEVYRDTTGFVECVKVVYDPALIGLRKSLSYIFTPSTHYRSTSRVTTSEHAIAQEYTTPTIVTVIGLRARIAQWRVRLVRGLLWSLSLYATSTMLRSITKTIWIRIQRVIAIYQHTSLSTLARQTNSHSQLCATSL